MKFLVVTPPSIYQFCSPFIFLLFVIITLAKWIIFLPFYVCRVNDSSVLFTRAGTSLLSPIQWKDDAKLLKQQLLYFFWWYFITGAAGWNYTFLVIFASPIGTPNILHVFIITPKFSLIQFYINLVHVSWNFLLTTRDQDRTNVFIFLIVLGSYISWSFIFLFMVLLPLVDQKCLCIQPIFHIHFFLRCFDFIWYVLRFIWIISALV